ncbi:MAG: hypothetical protein ACTSRP_15865 [Candidatus Helarchaeota archaeon]
MRFEKDIKKVYETVLNQIEKVENKIVDNKSMKEISIDELKDLGFSNSDIEYLLFKKRIFIKNKGVDLELANYPNDFQNILFEIPSDYYYKKMLSKQKVEQMKRLKKLDNMEE